MSSEYIIRLSCHCYLARFSATAELQEQSRIALTTVQALPLRQPFVCAFLLKVSQNIGDSSGQPSGITDLPRLQTAVWSTRRVNNRLASQESKISSLSVLFLNWGVVMGGLEEVIVFDLNSYLSPSVRQWTFTFCILKYLPLSLMASEMSTMVTPCSPQTFPCPFSQNKEVFSSKPTAIGRYRPTKNGAILPILPHTLKWVSKIMEVHLNPGILPAFSSY